MVAEGPVAYPDAVAAMEARVEAIASGEAAERVWLLEHPPLYTAGTSTRPGDGARSPLPIFASGPRWAGNLSRARAGAVAYVMLDLRRRAPDLRAFVAALEQWIIATLDAFAISGERREDRVGVWVHAARQGRPRPTASRRKTRSPRSGSACGAGSRSTASRLNVEPDLAHYDGITPCGIASSHLGVTSLADLGHIVSMPEVDAALRAAFERSFGPTR